MADITFEMVDYQGPYETGLMHGRAARGKYKAEDITAFIDRHLTPHLKSDIPKHDREYTQGFADGLTGK